MRGTLAVHRSLFGRRESRTEIMTGSSHMSRWDTAAEIADAHATQSEDERAVARPVVDALVASGAMKLWVPAAYGGGQADLATGLDAIAALAKADGATGWVVMIANTTALLSASLSPEVGTALYGDAGAITGGFAAPVGTATLAGDAASVSGRWAWGSGSSHATTMGGGVRWVDDSGASVEGPGGSRVGFAFFAEGVDLLDTWDASGMRASASTDYEVMGVHVSLDHATDGEAGRIVIERCPAGATIGGLPDPTGGRACPHGVRSVGVDHDRADSAADIARPEPLPVLRHAVGNFGHGFERGAALGESATEQACGQSLTGSDPRLCAHQASMRMAA